MQTCSFRWELSNGMSHSTCMHRDEVGSQLLMVGSQIANLTIGLSFCHNLCCKCPNGSCEPIFDIYILITFQWYKEHLNVRCFDPCGRTLKFWESQWTPKSRFRECEYHPPTFPKVRLWHYLTPTWNQKPIMKNRCQKLLVIWKTYLKPIFIVWNMKINAHCSKHISYLVIEMKTFNVP
jgi:hypothetical protein